MADKAGAKKPLVGPGGAKNIAAAKAAFGAPGAAAAAPAANGSASPQSRTRAGEAAKNEPPTKPGTTASALAGKPAAAKGTTPAQAAPVKEAVPEAVKPAPVAANASAKSQLAAKKPAAPASSDDSSSEESSSEDSDSDSDSDSDRKAKAKKIDVGVSLSSIKAAFQQDDKTRQQNVKKGYDVEEFKRQCKEAAERGGAGSEATVENEPTEQNPDIIRNAVQNDLGLDGIKSSAKDVRSRFENYNDSHADAGKGKEELELLKERSEVSGQKSKWENPESLVEKGPKQPVPDIEVAASKATKMKEKFEKKVRKEEKKNKTPKPKSRTSIQADHHE